MYRPGLKERLSYATLLIGTRRELVCACMRIVASKIDAQSNNEIIPLPLNVTPELRVEQRA